MNNQQVETLSVLGEIWKLSADVRLGQLMAHIGFLCETHVGKSLANIDDDELLAVLYRHRKELKARLDGDPARLPTADDPSTSISGNATTPANG